MRLLDRAFATAVILIAFLQILHGALLEDYLYSSVGFILLVLTRIYVEIIDRD